MSFIYRCPWCDRKIECAENDNGQYARCPCCDKTILVSKNPAVDGFSKPQEQQETKEPEKEKDLMFKCKECGEIITQKFGSTGSAVDCPACYCRFVVKPEDAVPENTAHQEQMDLTSGAQNELKEPLLTTLFLILGCLHGMVAFVSLVILVVKIDRNEDIFLSACGIGASVTCMLISFGLAEFFKLIGEISHNSQQTAYTLDVIRKILEEKK